MDTSPVELDLPDRRKREREREGKKKKRGTTCIALRRKEKKAGWLKFAISSYGFTNLKVDDSTLHILWSSIFSLILGYINMVTIYFTLIRKFSYIMAIDKYTYWQR